MYKAHVCPHSIRSVAAPLKTMSLDVQLETYHFPFSSDLGRVKFFRIMYWSVLNLFLVGHNKPITALVVLIAQARPDVIISLITTGAIYPKFVGELEKKLEKEEWEAIRARIK